MAHYLPIADVWTDTTPRGEVELIINQDHFLRVVTRGMLKAETSLDIMTADFKAMLVPIGKARKARSIVQHFRNLALRGVEIRLLHAGTPSAAALVELRKELPGNLTIRRCPRLHTKMVVIDSKMMYLGSANLTGAGLGAKADGRRNFEMGIWTESSELIERASGEFNNLWEGFECKRCKRREICPVPLEEPEL
jgi:phosphatidylserine/phosphatidylglycerophosphate/cardiolipin synthase-like enzyme